MATWYEVWGIEQGEQPPPVLLAKFPEESGGEEAAKEFAANLMDAGGTLSEIKKVTD